MDKFVGSKRLVIFSSKICCFFGHPEAFAEGWLNLFELSASREAESELFSHRKNNEFLTLKNDQEREATNLSMSDKAMTLHFFIPNRK